MCSQLTSPNEYTLHIQAAVKSGSVCCVGDADTTNNSTIPLIFIIINNNNLVHAVDSFIFRVLFHDLR